MIRKTATSPRKFSRQKFKTMKFEGVWRGLLSRPECNGSWIIYAESGHGKTTLALNMLKMICQHKKSAYIPLEEGLRKSFQRAFNSANLLAHSGNFKLWKNYTVEDIEYELSQPRAPEIIFIDSLQYLKMNDKSVNELTKLEYIELIHKYPKVTFIFISHSKNGEPKGALAEAVYYGSHICIQVKNHVAFPVKNRFEDENGGNQSLDLNDLL